MASSTFPCAARISAAQREGDEALVGPPPRRLLRDAVRVGEATLLEPDAREREQRRGAVGS